MLKRYTVPSVKNEGWAVIVLDTEIGFFATVSDYGSYAYIWSSPGCEFRKFLIQCEPDYLHGKLMMGRPDRSVFDAAATAAGIQEAIKEKLAEHNESGEYWKDQHDEEVLLEQFESDEVFDDWANDTTFGDAWEFARHIPEPQCHAFCEKVMPRFKELLRQELNAEEMNAHEDAHTVAVLQAAKPGILAEVSRELEQMTGICGSCNAINHQHHAMCPARGTTENG